VDDRAAPYVLAAGESRRDDAVLPFKALAADTGGRLSACEFTLGGWEPGPVLHKHDEVDEAFYVIRGKLEAHRACWRRSAPATAPPPSGRQSAPRTRQATTAPERHRVDLAVRRSCRW
jgi:hypothetical protein